MGYPANDTSANEWETRREVLHDGIFQIEGVKDAEIA